MVFVVEAVGGSRPAGYRPVWKRSCGLLEGRAGGCATHFDISMTRLGFFMVGGCGLGALGDSSCGSTASSGSFEQQQSSALKELICGSWALQFI